MNKNIEVLSIYETSGASIKPKQRIFAPWACILKIVNNMTICVLAPFGTPM